MDILQTRRLKPLHQYFICIALVVFFTFVCYQFADYISYRAVALVLLMLMSVIAMLFDVYPVLLAAFLSAVAWNFFFIPPTFTFSIRSTEDVLMFMLYFFVAFVNTVLGFKIRSDEKKVLEKEENEKQIIFYNTLLNSLSHELKTPLSTIVGAVDALVASDEKLSQEHKSILLSQIELASIRLTRQVENLLNMSRIESGHLQTSLDWCDSNELLFTLIEQFKNAQEDEEEHSFHFFSSEDMPMIKIDRGLVEQILHNILLNAVLYTPKYSKITVHSSYEESQWIVSVSDNGGGVAEEELPKLCRKFYRAPKTKTGGSGLGLSIVKGFVEMHNGTVDIFNNSDKGLTVSLKLPAQAAILQKDAHEQA